MSRKPISKRSRPRPKAVLRLPDLDQAKSAVLNSLTSADAQRGYRHAIDEFVGWYCSEPRLSFSRSVVLRYRIHLESRHLAPGTINLRLGAVRRLAYEAADCGLLSPDLAAGIRRVKGVKKIGVRLGNWLTAEQSQRLWQAPNGERLKEKRDRALLALLLACGGGGSWGLQIGVEGVDLVMLVMNNQGFQHLLSSKFELTGEGSVAAGPVGRHASAGTDWKMNTEVLTYSRSKGVFAGLTLEGAGVQQDDDSTRAIYGKNMTFRKILSGKASTPKSADAFMKAVSEAGQQARIAEATEDKK